MPTAPQPSNAPHVRASAVGEPLLGMTAEVPEPERADAARNRRLLLEAAQQLIAQQGAAAVTMDAVARAAGVGKGTVFRRFGSRTGLMFALLDHTESELQRAFLSGPAPLGPGAGPLERLMAYGRARLRQVAAHLDILLEAEPGGPERFSYPVARASQMHVRVLLQQLGLGDRIDVLTIALLAPLEAGAVEFLTASGMSIDEIGDQWECCARNLVG